MQLLFPLNISTGCLESSFKKRVGDSILSGKELNTKMTVSNRTALESNRGKYPTQVSGYATLSIFRSSRSLQT